MHRHVEIFAVILFISSGVFGRSKPFDVDDTKNSFYWRSDNEKCEPFETFKIDCNRCICSAEGVPYCTKVACIDMIQILRPKRRKYGTNKSSTMNFDFNENEINQLRHY